jgi:hypothetical protein
VSEDPTAIVVLGSALHPDARLPSHLLPIATDKGYRGRFTVRRKDWQGGICESTARTEDMEEAHRQAPGSLTLVPTRLLSFDIENIPLAFFAEDGLDPQSPQDIARFFERHAVPELSGTASVVMMTAGHLVSGQVRARITYLTALPVSQPEAKWLTGVFRARAEVALSGRPGWTKHVVDLAAASRHQAWYTARPEFLNATSGRVAPDPVRTRIALVDGVPRVSADTLTALLAMKPSQDTPEPVRAALEHRKSAPNGIKADLTKWEYRRRMRLPADGRWNTGNVQARMQTAFNVACAVEGNRHTTAAREGFNLGWLANTIPEWSREAEGLQRIYDEADTFFESYEEQARTLLDQHTASSAIFRVPYIFGFKQLPRGCSAHQRAIDVLVRRLFVKVLGMWKTAIPSQTEGLVFKDRAGELEALVESWYAVRDDFDSFAAPHNKATVGGRDVLTIPRRTFDNLKLEVVQEMQKDGVTIPEFRDEDIAKVANDLGILVHSERSPRHLTCARGTRGMRVLRKLHGAARWPEGQAPFGHGDNQFRGVFDVAAIEKAFGLDRHEVQAHFGISDPTLPFVLPETQHQAMAINSWRQIQARLAFRAAQRIEYHRDFHRVATGADCPHAEEALRAIARSVLWGLVTPELAPFDLGSHNTLDGIAGRPIADDIAPQPVGHGYRDIVYALMAHADGADPDSWLPTAEALERVGKVAREGAEAATRRKVMGAAAWLQSHLSQDGFSPPWLDSMVMFAKRDIWGHNHPVIRIVQRDDTHLFGKGIDFEELRAA